MSSSASTTRELLLNAAEQLFAQRGYAAVSVRDIAELAKANIAAVNYHFGSKSELYSSTVRRAMQRRESVSAWQLLEQRPTDRAHAAGLLVRFVQELVARTLTTGRSPACQLIMHEAAGPSDALDSVINDYLRPQEELLLNVIRALVPDATANEQHCSAHSVLGQVLHYVMLQPLIERLHMGPIDGEERLREIGNHIARFSLTALGCTPQETADAFALAATLEEVASS